MKNNSNNSSFTCPRITSEKGIYIVNPPPPLNFKNLFNENSYNNIPRHNENEGILTPI